MSGKRRKKHHYVPKVLQKAFCSEGDHIWYSTRLQDGRFSTPKDRNIESTFRIRDLYTVLDDDDQLTDVVETDFYGAIDNYLGGVLPQIISKIKIGKSPELVGNELSTFRKMMWEMIKRTPDFIKNHDNLEIGRAAITEILANETQSLLPERRMVLESNLQDDVKLIQYGRDVRVRGSLEKSEKVEEILKEFDLRWACISGSHSYILSGLMAYRIGNGGSNGLINPNAEIWFPLSPKVAAVLVRDEEGKIPLIVDEPRDQVRKINEYALRNSSGIASHSETLLRSLTTIRGAGLSRRPL